MIEYFLRISKNHLDVY